jgi:hypothetical protein
MVIQLAALKNISGGKKTAKPDGDSSSSVLYELMMKPETSKLEDQRRLAEMERRLEAIEKAVGATPDKMVRIPFYLEFVRSLHVVMWAELNVKNFSV